MSRTAKELEYIKNYTADHYDLMPISLKKGLKELLKIRCEQLGMNMSEYIRYCVEKEIEKDSTN